MPMAVPMARDGMRTVDTVSLEVSKRTVRSIQRAGTLGIGGHSISSWSIWDA